jgi:hypothetical protein
LFGNRRHSNVPLVISSAAQQSLRCFFDRYPRASRLQKSPATKKQGA